MDKNKTFTKYTCPLCNKEITISVWRLERKKTIFCKSCVTTGTQKNIKRPQFSNANSARWKGGRYISSDGYAMQKIEGQFTASGTQLYKKEHIVVYENHTGRTLNTIQGGGEQIHHIDGNKLHNNIENLAYCSDSTEHRNLHCQLEEVAFELVRRDIIKFNKETKKYEINESRIT
jgi:hypothetical protein